MWTEKLSLQFDLNNLEAKAVVLEVLTVLNGIVVQFSVGYEGRVAQPNGVLTLSTTLPMYMLSVVSVNLIVCVVWLLTSNWFSSYGCYDYWYRLKLLHVLKVSGILSIHWTQCAELPNEAGTGETLKDSRDSSLTARHFTTCAHDRPGGEGLVARLPFPLTDAIATFL